MRRVLILRLRTADALADEVLAGLRRMEGAEVKVVDLAQPDPDYDAALEELFRADSVQVW